MISHSFEEELRNTGKLICPNLGTSMLPIIRMGKDLMVIVPRSKRKLKKYQAVLYRRGDNYLLHRIREINNGEYTMCADNRPNREPGVKDSQIIGVLYSVLRDGKREIKVTSFAYKGYVVYWFFIKPLISKLKQNCKKLLGC